MLVFVTTAFVFKLMFDYPLEINIFSLSNFVATTNVWCKDLRLASLPSAFYIWLVNDHHVFFELLNLILNFNLKLDLQLGLVICGSLLVTIFSKTRHKGVTQKFDEQFPQSPDMLCLINADNHFKKVNSSFETILGFKKQELLSKPFNAFAHPEDQHIFTANLQKIANGLPLISFELRFLCLNGNYKWIEWSVAPLRGGKDLYAVGRDVTRRRQSAEFLQTSEARFRSLLEALPAIVYEVEAQFPYKPFYVSPQIESLGFSLEEWHGHDNLWLKLIHPDDRERVERATTDAMRRREKNEYEYRIITRNGEERWIHDQGQFIFDENNDPVCWQGVMLDITARKQAESSLRDSEERYRIVAETATDAIVTVDDDNSILYVNSAAEKVFGYTVPEMIGKNLEMLMPDYSPRVHRDAATLSNQHSAAQPILQLPGLHKSGREISVEISLGEFKNQHGHSFTGVIRDVSERQRVEKALQTSEAEMRALFAAMRDVILVADRDGRYLKVAPTNPSLLYKPPVEIVGKTIEELFPPERARLFMETVRRALELQAPVNIEYPLNIDGTDVWFSGTASPMEENSVIWVARDITERKQAEEALRASEKRYRQMFEKNLSVQLLIDPFSGEIVDANPAACDFYGYQREQLRVMNIKQINTLDSTSVAAEMQLAVMERHNRFVFRHQLASGDLRDVEVFSSPMEMDGRQLLYSIVYDITEHLRAQTALGESEEKLRQSQKLEAVGQLAGGIAHDFNNLLTAILGYSDLLLRQHPPDDPSHKKIVGINKAGERASGLTRQLLAFSRKQVLQPKVFCLNETVESIEEMLQHIIGEQIELVCALRTDCGLIKADPIEIERVLLNLAVNARDAMPDGGRLLIETNQVELSEDLAGSYGEVRAGLHVLLSITDFGVGISPEIKPRIFEPFFTTKELGHGTGLGLSTVYGIIKQSGGSIMVESEMGCGTTFKIYLPSVDDAPETLKSEFPKIQKSFSRKETILLVEDEEMVRAMTREILETNGYRVVEASRGEEALAFAEQFAETIDLLVTDVVMPRMNGRELSEKLLVQRPEIKVLFISGYTHDTFKDQVMLSDKIEFLQKPFKPEVLASKVRETLDAYQSL